jgi:pantoate--beta-alanine ligase
MRSAKGRSDRVIVTLFVNPIQFGPNEDLESYPRDFARDRSLAENEGADILFCPEAAEMYSNNFQTKVSVGLLSQGLCGADRPGHFDGVSTVVTKLFNITKPHIAVFGQKDYQQLAVIRQLVSDLSFDIEIVGHPIVREKDGLAMSSRNKYLDAEERTVATCLYSAIVEAQAMFRQHEGTLRAERIEIMARKKIESHPQCSVEYVRVIHAHTLQHVTTTDKESVLVLAMKVNRKVRLIDNALLAGTV